MKAGRRALPSTKLDTPASRSSFTKRSCKVLCARSTRPFAWLEESGASAPSRSALDGSGCFGGPAPGQQVAETAVGPVIDELGENVGEVRFGVDAVQFAGLDQ